MSMSYVPVFTTIDLVSAMTGETINDESDPKANQVIEWIEQVETEMIAKGYSTESITGVIMDVPEGKADYQRVLSESWIYDDATLLSGGLVVSLPNTPFISVANVQRNLQSYTQDASWEDLTEGPADESDFLIIKKKYKAGLRGFALLFYQNAPYAGYQRLKLDYVWGYNLPENVLKEYATARASVMLLYSKYMRKEPIFNLNIAGLRTDLNEFTGVHKYIIDRIEQIEHDWIPNQYTGVALVP